MSIKHITNPRDARNALKELSVCSLIGADTETSGLDPFVDVVTLIQLGTPDVQYVFDLWKLRNSGVLGYLKEILENPDIYKIFHNAQFDYKFLKRCLGILVEPIMDTLVFEQLLLKGKQKSGFTLDKVLKKYLDVEISKAQQTSFSGQPLGTTFTEEQIIYAGLDVRYLVPLAKAQRKLLATKNMLDVAMLECRCVAATSDMELNGMYLDQDRWRVLSKKAEKLRDQKKIDLDAHFIPIVGKNEDGSAAINYNSPVQLKPALSKLLGKQLESTNARILAKLKHPAAKALLEYREQAKLCSTYGENFFDLIRPETGRIHTRFNQINRTDSGRYSSSDPNL